ncbi:hypothetical protein [Archaeoglobus sp.]|uniref:NAD(P)/FAD-dependent oxidoreductase n=1 Tax=Archaeoglobus sp. TaxID=1872626 RepID=UPI0024AABB69|nr:hypothetical protein [Archaeoglobus sp.]MDI3497928.1 Tryptophan halogenase [Archaeoglobus sp.]
MKRTTDLLYNIDGAVEIVDRAEMEKKMASIAERNGATILTGTRVKLFGVTKMLSEFDLMVDATGYPSLWCREFGGKKGYAPAVQATCDKDIDKIVTMLHPNLDGYFWIFPLKRRVVRR